jgi:hypothetical protein
MDIKNFHQISIFFKKLYNDNELIPIYTILDLNKEEIIESIKKSIFNQNMKNNFIVIVEFIYTEYNENFNIVIMNKQISKIYISIKKSENKDTIYYSYDEYLYNNMILKIKNLNMERNEECKDFNLKKILLVSTILLSSIMIFGYVFKN